MWSLLVAAGSAALSAWAIRVAKRADARTAAFKRPVFKVASLRADERFTWLTVQNIAGEVALKVRIRLEDDPQGRLFQPSLTPGVYTGIVEMGATSTEAAPIGRDGWQIARFSLDRVVVHFETADGERHHQVLETPLMMGPED